MKTSKNFICKTILTVVICIVVGGLGATYAWFYCEYCKIVDTAYFDKKYEVIINAVGKKGLRDKDTGERVVAFEYDEITRADDFQLAKVQQGDKWGILECRNFKLLTSVQFDRLFFFDQNVPLCPAVKGDTLYFLDTLGKVQPFCFYALSGTDEDEYISYDEYGYCKVPVTINDRTSYYLIDRFGRALTGLPFLNIEPYPYLINDTGAFCGYYSVEAPSGFWGVIDTLGNTVLPCEYDELTIVSSFGFIVLKDDQRQLIGFDRELVTRNVYDGVDDEGDFYTKVSVNGMTGIVDGYGKLIIKPRWDNVYHFREDVFCASIDGFTLFLNSDDKLVQNP